MVNTNLKRFSSKNQIIILALSSITLFLFCCFSCFTLSLFGDSAGSNSTNKSNTNSEVQGEQIDPEVTKKVEDKTAYKVLSVTDGDTITIDYEGQEEKVRLIGIDTPEVVDPRKEVQCFGAEASVKMKELLTDKYVNIEFDSTQDQKDRYDRLLLYVWRVDDNLFVNDYMVREGYAHEYTYDKPYQYQEQFKKAEEEARNGQKGLWGNVCSCEKGEEKSRSCKSCNVAEVTKTNWDCSTYLETINDNSCSSLCITPVPTQSNIYIPPVNSTICKYSCSSPDRDCADFPTHAEAQAFFNCCGFTATNDPMKLDGLGVDDGIACESLP